MRMRQLPKDATVLITGASSGIGRATAECLAKRGFRVLGASRHVPAVMPRGVRDPWIVMDVRDGASAQAGIATIVAVAGRLNAVVCSAGYALFGSVEEVPIDRVRAQIETNLSLVEPGDIKTAFNEHTDWGDHDASAYSERRRRCERVIRESLPQAPGPELVAAVVLRALTARRPRVRYPVGPDSILVPFARRLLPDWLSLSLIRSHFNV